MTYYYFHQYVLLHLLLRDYCVLYGSIITYYYRNNGFIITYYYRSVIGNNGFSIPYY